jgi:halimadienyl-diphosphate synthase
MSIQSEFNQVLNEMGAGRGAISPSVYDIAWIAQLNEEGLDIGKQALEWLRANQLPDGSWGEKDVFYPHERLVCTLIALNTLGKNGDKKDHTRIESSLDAIDKYMNLLDQDPFGETIGFEMIVPTLYREAQELGLLKSDHPYLSKLSKMRQAKIDALPNGFINRNSTVIFSTEMIQPEEHALLDKPNMLEKNGSVGCSPSASVWHFKNFPESDSQALILSFLEKVVNENRLVPYIVPIDVFEIAWSLWNLALVPNLDQEVIENSQDLLDFLESLWSPRGLSAVSEFPVPDGDTTAMVHEVMSLFKRPLSIDGLLSFEGPDYFRCYQIESNPSISTNVHVLGALKNAGLPPDHPTAKVVRDFLYNSRITNSYWNDKWHTSPYYTTGHAVIAATNYDNELASPAVEWIVNSQLDNGGWGLYSSTAEETAYALQALSVWHMQGNKVPTDVLRKGRDWLHAHAEDQQPFLWIGKSLYKPISVVRTAILSALELTDSI